MKNLTEIHVVGGKSLAGNISIQGSKNAALPMMAAALMHRGLSILKGCPKISDVFCMEEILENLGAVTWWENHDLYLDCTNADKTEIPGEFTRRMRSSVILLSAILARNHSCRMGYPGGCVIGKRPIDIHLMVLKKLGAVIREEKSGLKGKCIGFTGGYICFPRVSVGATQQAVMASVLAEGETVLENCAKEPEVVWLCRFLKSMGANIKGEGTKQIRICGVNRLESGNFVIPPDRIVAGTYICAAAAARSEITLSRVPGSISENRWTILREKWYTKNQWKRGVSSCAICADRNLSRISHRSAGTAYGCSHRKSWRECRTGADF